MGRGVGTRWSVNQAQASAAARSSVPGSSNRWVGAGNDCDPALTAHERLGPPVELRTDVMGIGALWQHLPPDDEDLGEVDVVPIVSLWRRAGLRSAVRPSCQAEVRPQLTVPGVAARPAHECAAACSSGAARQSPGPAVAPRLTAVDSRSGAQGRPGNTRSVGSLYPGA